MFNGSEKMKFLRNNYIIAKKAFKNYKVYAVLSIVIGLLGAFSPIFSNYLIKDALDIGSSSFSIQKFYKTLICFLIYTLAVSIFSNHFSRVYTPAKLNDIARNIDLKIFKHALKLPVKNYDDPGFLNTYNYILSNGVSSAFDAFNSFASLITEIFSLSILFTLIISLEYKLLIICFISSIINFIINLKLSKISYDEQKELVYPERKSSYVSRTFSLRFYMKELKTTMLAVPLIKLFKSSVDEKTEINVDYGKKYERLLNLQSLLSNLSLALSFVLLVNMFINKKISAGEFAFAFNSFGQLSSSITSFLSIFPGMYRNSFVVEDILNFFSTPVCDEESGMELNEVDSVELKNASFSYDGTHENLKCINLKINKGEKVAFVGLNGAGKSTLASIITGLYKVDSGDYLINGSDAYAYKQKDLYKKFGIMLQDFNIYSLTAIENIFMDSSENISTIEKEQAFELIQRLALDNKFEDINKLCETYLTSELEDGGLNLSGGEEQKLALSRILIKPYDVLIFDEPSSRLDAYSEKGIFDSILEAYKEKTVIFISHRLRNIKNVDKIYYIEDGKIIESGNHIDLMNKKGAYYELYKVSSQSEQ